MNPIQYEQAGVSIETSNKFVDIIKPLARKTVRPEVLAGIGGFSALFEIPLERYKNPVLVSSTDGVGTKLRLATILNQHDTIGIDLVAMCVNDLLPSGAEPLFFLDYYACGKLDLTVANDIMQGIVKGCLQSKMALVGGETAEMPLIYRESEYDLAGFTVGIVEKSRILDGSRIKPGDNIIALSSSGLHSNGFSLIHKIMDQHCISLDLSFGVQTLGEVLITPTKIYVPSVLPLIQQDLIHGCAHIIGGGIIENLPRVLPNGVTASVDLDSFELPPIFSWVKETGPVFDTEMLRTFNCGVGMILIVSSQNTKLVLEHLEEMNDGAWILGKIIASEPLAKPNVECKGHLN